MMICADNIGLLDMYSRAWGGGGNSIPFSFLVFRPFFLFDPQKQKKRSSSPLCLSLLSFFVFFSLSTQRGRERNKFMGVLERVKKLETNSLFSSCKDRHEEGKKRQKFQGGGGGGGLKRKTSKKGRSSHRKREKRTRAQNTGTEREREGERWRGRW